jgi:beta-galactosidase
MTMKTSFTPGKIWLDLDGVPIQAHGGGILYHDGIYYWFGENKNGITRRNKVVGFNTDAIGVSCYASTDLYNWANQGLVLPAVGGPPEHDLHTSKIIERPKVIYNVLTRQFVMFVHIDTSDYRLARVGIALSDKPTGPYHYLGSIIPHNSDSRDMTVFKDEDGRAYLFHSSEWNATLYAGELSGDYCQTTNRFTRNFEKGYREAPAVFKRNGKYHLLTSGCTGWDPNPAQAAVAENILGPWKIRGNPCTGPSAGKTFFAQNTFVFPVAGRPDAYIAMFDRWNKLDLGASNYLWLPIRFNGEDVRIELQDEWDLSCFG